MIGGVEPVLEPIWITSAGIVLAASVVSASILLGIWLGGRISTAAAFRAVNTFPAELRERVEKVERDMLGWASAITDELDGLERKRRKASAAVSNVARAEAQAEKQRPLSDAEQRATIGRRMRSA